MWKAAAVMALFAASPAIGQEAGACLSIEDANAALEQSGEELVAHEQVGMFQFRFLVKRKDGTFKQTFMDQIVGQVCHVKDYIGDPRKDVSG